MQSRALYGKERFLYKFGRTPLRLQENLNNRKTGVEGKKEKEAEI